jgi:signal transduction histidine kinase
MAVPTQVAFKEVSQLRTNVILVAIAILASAIIAVIVFSKLVTEPLVKLKNVASEIAKGNFDVSAKVDSNDEIGELSRQFEKMKIDLRDRERLKDEFINIAAHELRSPLQPIISYNELALKGLIDKDEALKIIDIESQRFIQLANDILDVTRIEGGALTYQIQKVRLVDIIGRIVSSAKISSNLSNETTIELVTDEQSKGIEVDADINRLSQVFMNIIGNAVKFTRKGKIKISISAHPAQNEIEISVVDSGGGIPKDILPHLFGKFVTRSVKGGTEHGTGLGLFISKAIVLAHGGRIYGSNNSEGGATFTIFLPIKATKNIIINNGDNET